MAPNNSKNHQQQQTISKATTMTKSGSWVDGSNSFPYPVDYNDHFETPADAYRDLQPVLDWLTNSSCNTTTIPIGKTLYDPYYCNGRAKILLHEIGYDQVVHEKRDFYADVTNDTVPAYDIFITNPPYSDEHKIKCIDYCCTTQQQQNQQRNQQPSSYKPYFLLMPAYVATKQYMRSALPDLFFLIPSIEYQYHHPENTGKDSSPFTSLWYCGVGASRVDACVQHLLTLSSSQSSSSKSSSKSSSSWRLAKSLPELADLKMIRLQNRLNPRQRRKQRQHPNQQLLIASSNTTLAAVAETTEPDPTINKDLNLTTTRKNKAGGVDNGGSNSNSGSNSSSGQKWTTKTAAILNRLSFLHRSEEEEGIRNNARFFVSFLWVTKNATHRRR
jgi:hypothetical protein